MHDDLRPQSLKDFIGQKEVVANLEIFIQAANERKAPLDHILFHGPPGLGKTTLAHLIARHLGTQLHRSSGPILKRPADLAGILTNLQPRDVLFIDEIHRLHRSVEEYLYSAMEDFRIEILLDSGPHARSVTLSLAPFTLIGATTRVGLLTAPLRDRFGIVMRLDYYTEGELKQIIMRSAHCLGCRIEEAAAEELARRSRGTPRIANRLLKRCRDYAQVKQQSTITLAIVQETLNALGIDKKGLNDMDRRLLSVLIHRFDGGPVGIKTLATALGEEPHTIEEVHEPFLIRQGFLKRTPKGRIATASAYQYLKVAYPASLFDEE